MKPAVAIIGAGEPDGSILALMFARAECRLLLSDQDPQRARGVLTELRRTSAHAEAEILDCARTSCWEADIIVIATPSSSRGEVLKKIREVSTGKIVAAVVSSRSAGDLYARLLPHSRFVRLVCAGYGYTLSSDDNDALETVRRLMDRTGSGAPPVRLSPRRQGTAYNYHPHTSGEESL